MNPKIAGAFLSFLLNERGLSQVSAQAYLKHMGYLYKESGSEILDMRKYHEVSNLIIGIKNRRSWSDRMTYKVASMACVFFNWAQREELIEESPLRLGHGFKKNDNKQVEFFDWDSEDFKTLFSHYKNTTRDLVILHILRATGVRVSELAALKISDVDPEGFISVREGKGGKSRVVPYDEACRAHIEPYMASLKRTGSEWLFPVRKNEPLKAHSIWKMIYLRGKDLGVRAYPHKFRHSLAGRLIENGLDISAAAEILGHSSLSSTKIYSHFRKKELKKMYDRAIG